MGEEHVNNKLSEASPSVQTHLGIIQNVIERMSSNSTSSKAWSVTLVTAVLVLVSDKGKPELSLLALVPALQFAALDTYYLALEKGFRNTYKEFVFKVHSGTLTTDDLFEVVPEGKPSKLRLEALKSFSIWNFYGPLVLMVLIVWLVAM